MRNMSFTHTCDQVLGGAKTVTRRHGTWRFLKPGDLVMACRRTRGLKLDKIERIGPIRIISVREERLDSIDQAEVIREGFPNWTPAQFIAHFCEVMGGCPEWDVLRIEFEFLGDSPAPNP